MESDGEILLVLKLDSNVKKLAEEDYEHTENHIVHLYTAVRNHWGGCPKLALQQSAANDGCSNAIYA